MGNSVDKPVDGKYDKVMQSFNQISEINHHQLHVIRLYEAKEDKTQKIFQSSKTTTSDKETKQLLEHYNRRKLFDHDNLIKLYYIKTDDNSQMCSANNSISIVGEYYSNSVQKELEKYISQGQIYNESLIWYLTYQIVNACCYLQTRGSYHGDLQPQNIYLDDDGYVKLIEHNFIFGSTNAYQFSLMTNTQTLVAPELLPFYKSQTANPQNIDWQQADVFSLGLTLLELCSGLKSDIYYDWPQKLLIEDNLKSGIYQLKSRGYSSMLTNLIGLMISPVNDRPGFIDLQEILAKFEDQITSHSPFYATVNKQQVMGH